MTVIQLDQAQKFTSTVVPVDPERAARWLAEHNTHNRNIRKPHVSALARDMSAGRWSFNGAPLVFAADGTLLDGQHRLSAIIKSGVTLPMLVVRGVMAEAQHTMDTGARRSAADAYGLAGRGNRGMRATAVARLALILEGHSDGEKVSTAEIFDFLDGNPLVEACIEISRSQYKSSGLTPRVFDYCYWRLAAIAPDAAAEFFRSLVELTGLPSGSPIAALRRRLTGTYAEKGRQVTAEAQIALVFRAWNAWRDGRSLERIPISSRSGAVQIPEPR